MALRALYKSRTDGDVVQEYDDEAEVPEEPGDVRMPRLFAATVTPGEDIAAMNQSRRRRSTDPGAEDATGHLVVGWEGGIKGGDRRGSTRSVKGRRVSSRRVSSRKRSTVEVVDGEIVPDVMDDKKNCFRALTLARTAAAEAEANKGGDWCPLSPKASVCPATFHAGMAAALAKGQHGSSPTVGSPLGLLNRSKEQWYSPGRVRLRDVDPKRALQRAQQRDTKALGGFECSSKGAVCTTDANGRVQFTVSFGGVCHTSTNLRSGYEDEYSESSGDDKSSLAGSDAASSSSSSSEEEQQRDTSSPWRAVQKRMANGFLYRCASKNHAIFLRDQVYVTRCEELDMRVNTGVSSLLQKCSFTNMCFCNLEDVSFRNLLLGDRGVSGVLPLLTFARMLKSLNLSGNGMREASLHQLVAIMLEPSVLLNLMVLDISQNPLPSICAEGLMQFLPQRKSLLLVGLDRTNLSAINRQRLLRQVLMNFSGAEAPDMFEAWRLAKDSKRFTDRELWVRCTPVVAAKYDRETMMRADPIVKASSANVLKGIRMSQAGEDEEEDMIAKAPVNLNRRAEDRDMGLAAFATLMPGDGITTAEPKRKLASVLFADRPPPMQATVTQAMSHHRSAPADPGISQTARERLQPDSRHGSALAMMMEEHDEAEEHDGGHNNTLPSIVPTITLPTSAS